MHEALQVRRPSYRRYWLSLYRRDVDAASQIVDEALRVWPPQRIYLRLFEPALNLSGVFWARGLISYHDEHFVTHQTLRFMRRVRSRFVPLETCGPLALATGVAQESHLIGLRMVTDFLRWANWRIHWLSSNDRATTDAAVQRLRPEALLLSIGMDDGIAPASRLINCVRKSGYEGVIAVGGRAINSNPGLVAKVGADLTAPNGAALVRVLRPRFLKVGRSRLADDCDAADAPLSL